MASHPKPQFFVSRPDGTIVPLIALDELPENITIRGVPRNLSPADTAGMLSLGTVRPPDSFYIVDNQDNTLQSVANGRAGKDNNFSKNKKVRDSVSVSITTTNFTNQRGMK